MWQSHIHNHYMQFFPLQHCWFSTSLKPNHTFRVNEGSASEVNFIIRWCMYKLCADICTKANLLWQYGCVCVAGTQQHGYKTSIIQINNVNSIIFQLTAQPGCIIQCSIIILPLCSVAPCCSSHPVHQESSLLPPGQSRNHLLLLSVWKMLALTDVKVSLRRKKTLRDRVKCFYAI